MLSDRNKNAVSESDTVKKDTVRTAGKRETKSKVEKKTKPEPVVYLGPNIRGVVSHCDVFRDGCGSFFEEKAKEIPVLKDLCIPITAAGKKMMELKSGGAFCKLYEAAAEQLEKGAENE